jgi:hypothetical protein
MFGTVSESAQTKTLAGTGKRAYRVELSQNGKSRSAITQERLDYSVF